MSNRVIKEIDSLEDVESALKEMEGFLAKSRSRQKKYRRWSHGFTLGIVIVFIIYLFFFYKMFSSNLSSEKFSESIQNHMAEFSPVITNASVEVMTQVSPVYLDLAKKKSDILVPKLMESLGKQTDLFITNMSKFSRDELQSRLDRIIDKQAQEFEKAYPDLTDKQVERFIKETEENIELVFLQVSEHIVNQSMPEIMKMKFLTESLSEEHKHKDNLTLLRLFLHKLLLILDMEVMEGEIS